MDKLREERGLASLAEKRKGDAEKKSQEKARESAADKALQAADAISKKNKAKAAAGGILREDQPTEEDLKEVEQKKEIGELVSLMKELVGGDEDLVQDKLIKILSSESFAKQNNLSLQQGGTKQKLDVDSLSNLKAHDLLKCYMEAKVSSLAEIVFSPRALIPLTPSISFDV